MKKKFAVLKNGRARAHGWLAASGAVVRYFSSSTAYCIHQYIYRNCIHQYSYC
jgi:hypothetical protein